ncbi:hypothetical protein [Bdellovibrio sp. NC01]|uniref:hypothetical protein n=1 Tax=Bdellovibrio sp. NC01 TaxID=2220073 RepID=UPI00115A2748|nr:hypothetical protein [Bdellovibrio sp. NC01]QDK39441.1 hypothetical protein DOE51_18480 [Bdellovibrio sp. NC01]
MKKFGVLLTIFVCVTALNSVVFADPTANDSATKGDTPASTAGGSAIKDPTSPEGYTQDAQNLVAAVKAIETAAKAVVDGKVDELPVIEKLSSAASYYGNLHGTCVKTQATAKWLCREETSPDLQNTLNKINPLMALFNTVAVKDACDTFGKVMTMAQAGLTAYTAACSAARASCESSCSTVFNNIKQINDLASKMTGACEDIQAGACSNYKNTFTTNIKTIVQVASKETNEKEATLPKSIASKNKACTYTYGDMLVSAGTGILSVVRSLNQAQQCGDETNGSSTAANTPTADTAEKCSKPENAQLPECLCIANPRLPGCANGLQKAGENSTIGTMSALSSPNANSANKNGLSGADLSGGAAAGDERKVASDSSGSGAPGAPMGGGAGLGGSGGGGSGTGAPTGDANGKKGLDANILGGASGGGGGGGSWGMSGGSGSSDSKLRGYLPGGAQDPNKMAGQGNWTKEVTGQGGKSNWEKVRDRYRDNNTTLLNN